jgi:hypothetical protein
MLRLLHKGGERFIRFLAPDAGGTSGGSSGADGAGDVQLDVKLFDSLPWDELDDDSKAALEKIKAGTVATLQQQSTLSQALRTAQEVGRRFQGDYDRTKAELEKLTGNRDKANEEDPYIHAVGEELVKAGYAEADAKKLAPVFAGMFKRVGVLQKGEIGRDLAPMAETVLAGQANDAYLQALQQDTKLGMLQIPEVAQITWDMVKDRVKQRQETTPDVVLNIAKMAYADHLAAKGDGKTLETGTPTSGAGGLSPTPPAMRTGSFPMIPGSSFSAPAFNRVADPNAPRTQVNDDTRKALAETFKTMTAGTGIVPKELKDVMGNRRR